MVGQVVRVDGVADTKVDSGRLLENVRRFLRSWKDNGGRIVGFDDIDELRAHDFDIKRPAHVYWEPISTWYQCTNRDCLRVHDNRNFTGRCRQCASALMQFPYIFYHNCGDMRPLRPTLGDHCPEHKADHLYFRDTRNLRTSQWVCRECGHASTAFYPYCGNASCRATKPQHGRYQISYWRDPWSYYTQKVDYVNLDEARAREFVGSDRGRCLIHDAVIGTRPAGRDRLFDALNSGGGNCVHCGATLRHGAAFCDRCGKALPPTATEQIDAEIAALQISAHGGRVAYAILRDLTETESLQAGLSEPNATTSMVQGAADLGQMGISDIVLVKAFPLTTVAFGYTRERPGPESWLNAFPRDDERISVFTNTTTTEGWLVQLRATAILAWLERNDLLFPGHNGPAPGIDETTAKDWLVRRMVDEDPQIFPAVRNLIHSYSHAMLKSLANVCGLEASSLGELLWPDALAFAIYAGETDLGALSAAFEQGVDQLADQLLEYAACMFDPTCAVDEQGACVGCLHLTRGCERFNSDLSRAYLVGGAAGDLLENAVGFFAVAAIT